jgi:hypothetical protein
MPNAWGFDFPFQRKDWEGHGFNRALQIRSRPASPQPCHSERSRSASDGGVEEPVVLLHSHCSRAENEREDLTKVCATVEERRFSAASNVPKTASFSP